MLGHIAAIIWNGILLALFLVVAVIAIAAMFAIAPAAIGAASFCWPIVALALAALLVVALAR